MTVPAAASPPLLKACGICKRFPGVQALWDVNLSLSGGEVVAVIGENGAGKSTLMKILSGVQAPDAGELRLGGKTVRIDSVRTAQALGIALIHQELNLADNLDVGANLFLGREPRWFGLIDRRRIEAASREVLGRVGLDCHPKTVVGTLGIGYQQMVEIAKALAADARILIMDEPTSSLSAREADRLFDLIRDLKRRGVSILYISHRLGEVKEIADRVVVLRDGRNAGELHRDEIDHDRMVRLMVGRDLAQFYGRKVHPPGEPLLGVERLRTRAHPQHELSFAVRAGEIVGLAGLVGAGRTEVLEALFGVVPALAGTVRVAGRSLRPGKPLDAIRAGMALVPEDRKQQGLILEMSVRHNLSLVEVGRRGVLRGLPFAEERRLAAEMSRRLQIRAPSDAQIVQLLSGGNQQKVVLGKWLALRPLVLLCDEPTRGVDVGAKQEMYRIMERLAGEGVAILFVSSEMEEVLGMSDRVLVMHLGRIAGELARHQLSEEAILRLATGGVPLPQAG
jgi:ribose transport system ATP-binding protein